MNLRPSGYEATTKACRRDQAVSTHRNPSTHRAALQPRRYKLHQGSTRILVSRWSAAVSREFSIQVPTTACSLPHRRRPASTSPSTCFAEPARRGVWTTGGSSMRSGSRQPPLLPSRAPGGIRKGRTRDGCRGSPDEACWLSRPAHAGRLTCSPPWCRSFPCSHSLFGPLSSSSITCSSRSWTT